MRTIATFISVFFFVIGSIAQSDVQKRTTFIIPDSLKIMSYKEITNCYYKNESHLEKSEIIAKTYLQKAKNENNAERMAEGYHFMSFFNKNNEKELLYLDSIIIVTKELKNSDYPILGYIRKAEYFHRKRNFIKALDIFMIAYRESQKVNNLELLYRARYDIGILKIRLGNYKESLLIFKECENYYLKQKDTNAYLITSFFVVTIE